MDSPERASDTLSALEGAFQDASREACASLEDRILTKGPPDAARVEGEARSEIDDGLSFSAKLANAGRSRPRLHDRLMLGSYVLQQEWDCPSVDVVAPGPKAAREIIDR